MEEARRKPSAPAVCLAALRASHRPRLPRTRDWIWSWASASSASLPADGPCGRPSPASKAGHAHAMVTYSNICDINSQKKGLGVKRYESTKILVLRFFFNECPSMHGDPKARGPLRGRAGLCREQGTPTWELEGQAALHTGPAPCPRDSVLGVLRCFQTNCSHRNPSRGMQGLLRSGTSCNAVTWALSRSQNA